MIKFLYKLKNPLILLLLFASFFSFIFHSTLDFILIIIMVFISIILDTILEHRSEKAAEHLQKKVAIKAHVVREGKEGIIPVEQLVVGDLVLLYAGNIIPADLKIISSEDLHVDESTLTGESFPVAKKNFSEVYMGTQVVNGEGLALVATIGVNTRFGQIADKLSLTPQETDFEKGIKQFGVLVMKIALVLVAAILIINLLYQRPILETFMFALALAIGLTPELLPMIMTVNLAEGALRMAKKGVIVKHLPAIHNFGSMNILCTDKTGTLTENHIRLERHENPQGEEDQKVLELAYLNSFFQSNLKGPLEEAVLRHHEQINHHNWQKIDEIPFDFHRKRLSVLLKKDREHILIGKGAFEGFEELIKFYDDKGEVKPLTSHMTDKIHHRFEELSQEGFRILAVVYRKFKEAPTNLSKSDEKDLVLAGFAAFLDPPKEEARQVISTLLNEGIELKILTGDNELVTQKICQELNIKVNGTITGSKLLGLSEHEYKKIVQTNTIFASLTPDQKTNLINALQRNGAVVGYLGDGINDANSLRQSDVGISVNNAVDIAKDSADIILTQKSLNVLRDGVIEGRKIFTNTTKYIFMNFGSNFGNMISISLASLFLPFLPMLPIQLIINNLLYDFSQLSLPSDNVDSQDTLKPQKWDMATIQKFIFTFGPLSTFFDLITFIFLLHFLHIDIPTFRSGWFVESLATQALVILILRTKIVPFIKSKPSIYMIISALGILSAAIYITQSYPAGDFQFGHLPLVYWGFLIIIMIFNAIMMEMLKKLFYREKKVMQLAS